MPATSIGYILLYVDNIRRPTLLWSYIIVMTPNLSIYFVITLHFYLYVYLSISINICLVIKPHYTNVSTYLYISCKHVSFISTLSNYLCLSIYLVIKPHLHTHLSLLCNYNSFISIYLPVSICLSI